MHKRERSSKSHECSPSNRYCGHGAANNGTKSKFLLTTVMNDQLNKTEETLEALRRAEQKYRSIFETLAEVRHLGEASRKIVQSICESVGWDFGDMWRVDPTANLLRCVDIWHAPEFHAHEFIEATQKTTFEAGVGLPGRVWSSRKAFWIPDVCVDSNFPRRAVAARGGLHGAFAFPIMLGSEVIGVMEFFSRGIHPPDDDLLAMLSALGTQIGSFVQREQLADKLDRCADSACE
jgi:GAF domain-containing protein